MEAAGLAARIISRRPKGLRDRNACDPLRRAAEFLPSSILEELGDDLAHYPDVLAEVNAERTDRGLQPWEFHDVEVLAIAALTYSALFLGLAFLNMRKRDM